MSNRRIKPDSSQLEHWRRDHVTIWVMDRLMEQFRPLKASQRAASWDDYNDRVGSAKVLEAIEKLSRGE